MKSSPPALLPILRSDGLARVLAALFSVRDLPAKTIEAVATEAGVSYPLAHREVTRLVDSGLLHEQRVGNARLVQANVASPLVAPLRQLLERSFGIPVLLHHVLADVSGIHAVAIFGSLARRLQGEHGLVPNDIDVLVIGHPDRDLVNRRLDDLEKRAGFEVNVTFMSQDKWNSAQDSFTKTVKSQPIEWVFDAQR